MMHGRAATGKIPVVDFMDRGVKTVARVGHRLLPLVVLLALACEGGAAPSPPPSDLGAPGEDAGGDSSRPEPLCVPGTSVCAGPRATAFCGPDGASLVGHLPCAAAQRCDPALGRCIPGCTPDTTRCESPSTLLRCSEDCLWVAETCAEGAMCLGEGPCVVCVPGSTRCTADGLLQSCEESDGAPVWGAVTPCPGSSRCREGWSGCRSCNGTACLGETSYLACTEDGGSYDAFCPEGQFCRPGVGCVLCLAGEEGCDPQGARGLCASDGLRWEPAAPCEEGQACLPGGGPDCLPCARYCLGIDRVLGCEEGWGVPQACPEGQLCVQGRGCLLCVPGATECDDVGAWRRCAEDGQSWEPSVPCGVGRICVPEEGACHPCREDLVLCQGADARVSCEDGQPVRRACPEGELCVQGECRTPLCPVEVVILIDRSASMARSWEAVGRSVHHLVMSHPGVLFSVLAFPGVAGGEGEWTTMPSLPFTTPTALSAWFSFLWPAGSTPLQPAMLEVALHIEEIWSRSEEPGTSRYLVLLSDGEGLFCVDDPLATLADPRTGDCSVDGLATATRHLRDGGRVRSYVIGYRFEGDDRQLLAVAENGGTSFPRYVVAGDEPSLRDAFTAFLYDPKLCEEW